MKQHKSPYEKDTDYEIILDNKKHIVRLDKSAHLERSKRKGEKIWGRQDSDVARYQSLRYR